MFSAPGSVRLVPITERFRSSTSYTAGRVEVFYNGDWGTVCGRNVNKATADALCAEVTGEQTSFALVYGTAGSSGLPYVFHYVHVSIIIHAGLALILRTCL